MLLLIDIASIVRSNECISGSFLIAYIQCDDDIFDSHIPYMLTDGKFNEKLPVSIDFRPLFENDFRPKIIEFKWSQISVMWISIELVKVEHTVTEF